MNFEYAAKVSFCRGLWSWYTASMVRKAHWWFLQKLDQLSVRRKLILSYVLGFILPLALVSVATWVILTAQARRADERQADATMTLIQNQLYQNLDAASRLAGLLGTDQLIKTALDDWRIDRVGHLVQYRIRLGSYIDSYVTAYPQVDRVEFYTSNPAVVRGGSILLLDERSQSSEWARALAESDRRTVTVLHVDRALLSDARTLSLVRDLGVNLTPGPRIETYLRVDFALTEIRGIIARSNPTGTIFLVDEMNNVVVSNVPAANDFRSMASLGSVMSREPSQLLLERSIAPSGPFADLRLVGSFPYSSTASLSADITLSAIAVGLSGIAIASLIQLSIGYSLSRRLQLLTRRVMAAGRNHFPIVTEKPGNDELGTLIIAYNEMTATIDRLMTEVYEEGLTVNRLAVEKRHAELEALISKIDPHFLSNSLNTIRMKSLGRGETETAMALKALGRLFDYMTAWQDETILVRNELEFISGFLELQRYRFGAAYQFDIQAAPDAQDLPIPRMIVQPIVENASRHGIEELKRRGKISVLFSKEGERLVVTVRDNGQGMDYETLERQRRRLGERSRNGESIGMQNVYNRLMLIFGDDAEFELDSRPGMGTTVRMSFPYSRLESHVESYSC